MKPSPNTSKGHSEFAEISSASLPTSEREPLTFFLSFDHLAYRLGIFGTAGP